VATSYAWARGLDPSYPDYAGLSADAREALGWAQELDEAAQARQLAAIGRQNPELATVTIAEIAKGESISATTVRRRIAHARFELFGSLSDRGIRDRKNRWQELKNRPPKRCEHEGCEEELPIDLGRPRRYCSWHGLPWARAHRARLRLRRSPTPEDGAHGDTHENKAGLAVRAVRTSS
jgi:hypothetical protein